MKTEFKSKVTKYASGRYHIEIPSYVREDLEDFIGEKIIVDIKIKSQSTKDNEQIKTKFESKVTTYGPERLHIEIPSSLKNESKKLLGEKLIVSIKIINNQK